MDLATLAQQVTDIIVPALPIMYAGGKVATDKGKYMLVEGGKAVIDKSKDMILERCIEKLGSKGGEKAKTLFDKISSKKGEKLEKALINISKNSEDLKAKEEFKQEILKLLREDLNLARDIEHIINLNVENVGLLAVGNYSNFFNLETPSGDELIKLIEYLDLKRKEAVNQKITSCYNPSALPYYPERLKKFVTENRADELRKVLTYIEKHRILLISGIGGVGKSTLARALIELRPTNVPEPFWLSFYENQDVKLGDILEKLASYLNAPEIASFKTEMREPEKLDVDKLTDEFKKRDQIWLIFDDLNIMLEDQHFSDKSIDLLFSSLRYNTHNAKIIITSRDLPIFENGDSLVDLIEDEENHHLNGLRINYAVDYLIRNGLDNIELYKLEELVTSVDGHPLALRLLIELIKEYGAAEVLEDLSLFEGKKEKTILKARRLFDKLVGNERELLERLSVYREPIAMKAITAMFTEMTSQDSVSRLLNKSLLETNHSGSYWLHPLIQEFAYKELKNRKDAHFSACKYYIYVPLPEKPSKIEEVQSLIEAHYHACNAGRVDLAARILYHSNLYGQLDSFGNFRTIVELCAPLLPCISFEGRIISLECHGFLLGILGIAIYRLRYPKEAITFLEEALNVERLRGDKKREGDQLGNLGLAYEKLGEYRKAIEYYEQALKISEEIGDQIGELSTYENLGNVYSKFGDMEQSILNYEKASKKIELIGNKKHQAYHFGNLGALCAKVGKFYESISYLERSIKISEEIGDKRNERTQYMNMGTAYSDLKNFEKCRECYKKAIRISIEIRGEKGEGDLLTNIGNLCQKCGQIEDAIKCYNQSLEIDRKSEDIRGECLNLANLGNSYASIRQLDIAIEFYEEGRRIAKKIGDIRIECQIQVNLGNAYVDLGQVERAFSCFTEALSLGKKIKDPTIIEKCETALNSNYK